MKKIILFSFLYLFGLFVACLFAQEPTMIDCGTRESEWRISAKKDDTGVEWTNKRNHQLRKLDDDFAKCIKLIQDKICYYEQLPRKSSEDRKNCARLYKQLGDLIYNYKEPKDTLIWISTDINNKPLNQQFTFEADQSKKGCPSGQCHYDGQFELSVKDAEIICVSLESIDGKLDSFNPLEDQIPNCPCSGDGCLRPNKKEGPFCAGADTRCQFCINYLIHENRRSFTYHRACSEGKKVKEIYTVYYKIPNKAKVSNCPPLDINKEGKR